MKNYRTRSSTSHTAAVPSKRRLASCVKWMAVVALSLAGQAGAATIRVPQDQATITAGIAAASPGDTVAVSPGTYNEYNIPITKPVTVTSVGNATNTIVDMQHNGRGFLITNSASTAVNLLGLTIQNATIPYYSGGGAVLIVSGKCRISGCIIQGTSGAADYSGGPISNWSTNIDDVLLDNCVVRNNFAANGCAISGCAAYRCLIYNNSAGNNPMALSGCHATNCTVYNNTGGFLGNSWTAGGLAGGIAVNCIFWGNSGHNGQQIDPGSSATVTYSTVQGGFTGTGNLNSDPLFVNPATGDFHLQTNSPAKNSGDPTILNVDGSRSDIGAYGGGVLTENPPLAQSLLLPQANFELIQAIQDQSSRVWVLGAFTNNVTVGTKTFTSRGQRDVLLIQYSPAGFVNWAATIGGIYDDVYTTGYVPGAVRMSVQSNTCVVAGWENASLTVVDGLNATTSTAYNAGNKTQGSDGYLLKFNSAGSLVWKASITGTSAGDGGQFAAIDNSGNVYWVGSYNGCCPTQGGATVTDGVGGATGITSPSFGTGFLIKFNSAGAYQWSAKCYSRDADFQGGVTVDNAGSVFVAGYSRANSSGTATTLIDAGGNVQSVANGGIQSTFLAKFTSNGIYQWSLSTPGGPDGVNYVGYNALSAATNGDVFLAGTYNTVGLNFGGQSPQLPVPSGQDGFVGCINSNGQVKWLTQFGGAGDQAVGSLDLLSNSQALAGGRTTNGLIMASTNLTSLGGADGFVVTLSTNGSPLNATLIGQASDNDVRNAQGTTSGVRMIAGQTMAGFQAYGITFTNAGAYVGLVNTSTNQPPAIITQPVSQSVNQGSPVSFSVTATGTGLGYQWRLNSLPLSGATNASYGIGSVTTNHAGTYTVVVSNTGGSVTSSNAVLAVILPPRTGRGTATLIGSFLVTVNITDGGCGYTNTPLVRFVGGGGSGAQATAVVSNGVITAINVFDAGYGYTSAPLVVIDPPFIPNPILSIAPMSYLAFSNLTVGGVYQLQRSVAWYWSNQPVSFTATNDLYAQMVAGVAGSGDYRLALNPVPAQAFATAVVNYGFVVHATVNSGGSGYVTSPAVTISGGGGVNATAVSHVTGGVVTDISISSAGFGYTNTPAIRIAAPPAAAVAPTVWPVMRVDSRNLAPYDNYQVQFKPELGGAWGNWDGGLFTSAGGTNSQYLFITNGPGLFRLQYVP